MAWAATQAKAKFSEVLDKAEAEGPQLVRRRKQEFILLTREQHEALTERKLSGKVKSKEKTSVGTLGDFFRNSPLAGSGIKVERLKVRPRRIEF